jgi:hypothetical protein
MQSSLFTIIWERAVEGYALGRVFSSPEKSIWDLVGHLWILKTQGPIPIRLPKIKILNHIS